MRLQLIIVSELASAFACSTLRAVKSGRLNSDLINRVDILATTCQSAGFEIPANVDGVSFLSQLRGEPGKPREWLYSWYSPRQNDDLTVREHAFARHDKPYHTCLFFDLNADPLETKPLEEAGFTAAAAKKLRTALEQIQDVRPAELDQKL
ncbi:MAG: hypothetical protein Q8K78_05950 [Planctomycetaceae bacterium]|nr:hypothetical protein [Planctomycetaceae bacterium]